MPQWRRPQDPAAPVVGFSGSPVLSVGSRCGEDRWPRSPPTRASLLLRLRDAQDGGAWREFVDLYAPLVYGYARKQGLQDADAADLSQDEPRVKKRRRNHYGWLTKPRAELKRKMAKGVNKK